MAFGKPFVVLPLQTSVVLGNRGVLWQAKWGGLNLSPDFPKRWARGWAGVPRDTRCHLGGRAEAQPPASPTMCCVLIAPSSDPRTSG